MWNWDVCLLIWWLILRTSILIFYILIGVCFGHCEISRSPVDSSIIIQYCAEQCPSPAPAEALTHSTNLIITKLDCVMDLIPYKKLPNVHLFHPIILLFQFNDGFIINWFFKVSLSCMCIDIYLSKEYSSKVSLDICYLLFLLDNYVQTALVLVGWEVMVGTREL